MEATQPISGGAAHTEIQAPAPAGAQNRSGSVATDPVDLPLDLCFVLVAPVEHVPGVHHQADPPTQDQEHGPEESAVADRRPDRDDDGVDEHEHQQMSVEVTAFPYLPDCPLTQEFLFAPLVGDHRWPPSVPQL